MCGGLVIYAPVLREAICFDSHPADGIFRANLRIEVWSDVAGKISENEVGACALHGQ